MIIHYLFIGCIVAILLNKRHCYENKRSGYPKPDWVDGVIVVVLWPIWVTYAFCGFIKSILKQLREL